MEGLCLAKVMSPLNLTPMADIASLSQHSILLSPEKAPDLRIRVAHEMKPVLQPCSVDTLALELNEAW